MAHFTSTALNSWDPNTITAIEKVMNPAILAKFMKRWRYVGVGENTFIQIN